jgi:hypothetical protein
VPYYCGGQHGAPHAISGEADYDETLSNWHDIGRGVKMPFHQLMTLNGTKIFDTMLTDVSFNPGLPADAFTVRGRSCAARRRHRISSGSSVAAETAESRAVAKSQCSKVQRAIGYAGLAIRISTTATRTIG